MNSPLLGLDIGFKRTGVALSESGLLARPLTTLEAKPPHMHGIVQDIISLVKEHEAVTLVIGMPYREDDAPTEQSLKVDQVVTQLEDRLRETGLTVEIVRMNEFHSTRDAALLFPRDDPDAAAAALILQSYLDQTS